MKRGVKWMASFALTAALLTAALPTEAATFKDVPEKMEYYEAVEKLVALGAVNTSSGQFNPRNDLTRGQAAKIIALAFKLPYKPVTQSAFRDVPASAEFAPYIMALAEAKIINGYGDETFKPGAKLTRGQMAKILSNLLKLENESNSPYVFTDVPTTNSYAPYVYALANATITRGRSDGSFGIKDTVKRSQFALFVNRAINYQMYGIGDIYPFSTPIEDYVEDGTSVVLTKVEAVRLSDDKMFTLIKTEDQFMMSLPDQELYQMNYYVGAKIVKQSFAKKPENLKEMNMHIPMYENENPQQNFIEISDIFGIANILDYEPVDDQYEVLVGDKQSVEVVTNDDPDLGVYKSLIFHKPGIYVIRGKLDGEYTHKAYVEIMEHDGKLYYYVPDFGV